MPILRRDKKFREHLNSRISNLHDLLFYSFNNVHTDTQNLFSSIQQVHQKTALHEEKLDKIYSHQKAFGHFAEELRKIAQSQHHYLRDIYEKMAKQDALIDALQRQLEDAPLNKEKMKETFDELMLLDDLNARIAAIESQIDDMQMSHSDLLRSHLELKGKRVELREKSEVQEPISLIHEAPLPAKLHELTARLDQLEQKRQFAREKIFRKIAKNTKDFVKGIIISTIRKYGSVSAFTLKEMIVLEQGLCSKSSFYRLLEEIEQEPDIGVIREGKEKKYLAKLHQDQRAHEQMAQEQRLHGKGAQEEGAKGQKSRDFRRKK